MVARPTRSYFAFGLEGNPPQAFVEHVEGEAAFHVVERIASVASMEPGTTDPLEELSVRAAEASDVALRDA